jgi:hypothetical protein
MSDQTTKLSGPDLTQAIELSTIPDGTMLLGHAQGEGVVQKWPVLGNTDNKNPAARQGWF